MNVNIKIVNLSTNPLPAYQTAHAAGLDLCANLSEPVLLHPLGRQLIPTGLFIELPEHAEAQIRPRSGLALKYGITVLNSPGTIDADYRGEIMVLLINFSNEPFTIHHGERIAQMVVSRVEQAHLVEVMELTSSDRSTGGFGSTGH